MRTSLLLIGLAAMTATAAHAESQSSNTSSNSSSNNGVVRDRIVDTYCADGYCERFVSRRVYRDDRRHRRYRDGEVRRHRSHDRVRYDRRDDDD